MFLKMMLLQRVGILEFSATYFTNGLLGKMNVLHMFPGRAHLDQNYSTIFALAFAKR